MEFKKADKTKIPNIATYIKEFFYTTPDDGYPYVLWIGCDSIYLKGKKKSEFVIVVCFYKWKRGAHIVHRRIHLKTKSILDRLWKEVELSKEVADFLKDQGILTMKTIRRDKRSLMPEPIHKFLLSQKTHDHNSNPVFEEKTQFLPHLMRKDEKNEGSSIVQANCVDFRIDIDFNSKEADHKGKPLESNKLHDSAIYYIEGFGYQCIAKPDAFAATYAANDLLKKK